MTKVILAEEFPLLQNLSVNCKKSLNVHHHDTGPSKTKRDISSVNNICVNVFFNNFVLSTANSKVPSMHSNFGISSNFIAYSLFKYCNMQ